MTKKKEVIETKEESKTFNIIDSTKLSQVILGLDSAKLDYELDASFLTVSGKSLVLVRKMLGE